MKKLFLVTLLFSLSGLAGAKVVGPNDASLDDDLGFSVSEVEEDSQRKVASEDNDDEKVSEDDQDRDVASDKESESTIKYWKY